MIVITVKSILTKSYKLSNHVNLYHDYSLLSKTLPGDLSDHCNGAGGHYDPLGTANGDMREVGDLGYIEANEEGVAEIMFDDEVALLGGPHSIIGRAMVVHEGNQIFYNYGIVTIG